MLERVITHFELFSFQYLCCFPALYSWGLKLRLLALLFSADLAHGLALKIDTMRSVI